MNFDKFYKFGNELVGNLNLGLIVYNAYLACKLSWIMGLMVLIGEILVFVRCVRDVCIKNSRILDVDEIDRNELAKKFNLDFCINFILMCFLKYT